MKNKYLHHVFFIAFFMFVSGCNTAPIKHGIANESTSRETLYVYADGKMRLDSRYVDRQDVVIYPDGKGGEKAAVKVRVPIHSDFYRDSILVVRVVNKFEESVAQQESENLDNFN